MQPPAKPQVGSRAFRVRRNGVLIIALAWVGIVAMAAHAAADDAFVDPLPPAVAFAFEPSRAITNEDPDTDIARFGLDAASWVPQIIAEMNAANGPDYEPQQIMLIEGADEQPYLVITWGQSLYSKVEFHRVTELGEERVLLTHVRTLDHYNLYEIVSLTGNDLFPGEAPVVVLYREFGSLRCGMGYDLVQLRRDTVDITPVWSPFIDGFADLDEDGVAEVITDDPSLGYDCGLEKGAIPRILRRVDGRFVDACANFPGLYAYWNELVRELGFRGPYLDELLAPVYQQTREALILAQAGHVEAAIMRAQQMISTLPAHVLDYAEVNARWLLEYGWPETPISLEALLQHARTVSGGCPASAALQDMGVGMISRGEIDRTERVTGQLR